MSEDRVFMEEIMKERIKSERAERINYFEPENNMEDGYIVINYEKIELSLVIFDDMGMQMILPDNLLFYTEEMKKKKYENEVVPDLVLGTENGWPVLTFTRLKEHPEEVFENAKEVIIDGICDTFPGLIMECKIFTYNDGADGKFFALSGTISGNNMYMILFLKILSDELLVGSFECEGYDRKQWDKIILDIIKTLTRFE